MLKKLFSKKNVQEDKASMIEGIRVYAVGDIHGRFDLLQKMHNLIIEDASNYQDKKIVIYLGDYIDRGFESKEVVDCLIAKPLEGFETIFLKGNHEYAMKMFLDSPEAADAWLFWGGDATLQSYGVNLRDKKGKRKSNQQLSADLQEAMPDNHRLFFDNLDYFYTKGDYYFVHAGLRPGVPIEQQNEEDMLMIREEFILSKKRFDKTIVFGHTIFSEPLNQNGRIGVDTGAYASGMLTSVVLEGEDARFLTVS